MDQPHYQSLINESKTGFSYQKVLLNDAGVPIDFELLDMNDAFSNLVGRPKTDLIGKKGTQFLPQIISDPKEWINFIGKASCGSKATDMHVHLSSTANWCHINAFSPETGFVVSMISKLSQQQYFQELFKLHPDLAFITDQKGTVLGANQTWENALGYQLGEATQIPLHSLFHPDDQPARIYSTGSQPYHDTSRFLCRDGSFRHLDWHCILKDNLCLISVRDVTDKFRETNKIDLLTSSLQDFLRMSAQSIDYQHITNTLLALADAFCVGYHQYNPTLQSFEAMAFTCANTGLAEHALKSIPFLKRAWPQSALRNIQSEQTYSVYSSCEELQKSVLPEGTVPVSLDVGETILYKIQKDAAIIGYLTIIMPKDAPFLHADLISIYAKSVGLLLDRIQTEEKLSQSREMLGEAQLIAQLGRWEWNHKFDSLSITPQINCLFELDDSITSLPYRQFLAFVHPADKYKLQQMRFEHISQETYEILFRVFTKHGTLKWVNLIGRTILDSEGNPVRSIGTIQDVSKLKNAEEKIKELLDQNETIFTGTQNGLFLVKVLVNNNFKSIKCNPSFEKITGISESTFYGKLPEELFGEKIGKQFSRRFSRCLESKQPLSFEETVHLPVGIRIWSISLTPIFDNEKPVFIVGSIQDSTLSKIAAQEVKANLELNKKLLGLITSQSQTVNELLSLSLEQVIRLTRSRDGYVFLYDEDTKEFTFRIYSTRTFQKCNVREDVIKYSYKDAGLLAEVVCSKQPVIQNNYNEASHARMLPPGHVPIRNFLSVPIQDDGRIVAVAAIANKNTDYTEKDILTLNLVMNNVWSAIDRKKNSELLKQEKELFQTTLLSIGDAIIATDKEGKIILINEVAQQLTGWHKDLAVGRDYHDVVQIIHEKTRKRCEPPITRVMESGRISAMVNHTILIAKGGQEYPITNSAAPIIGHDGSVNGVVMALRDVTLEKQKLDAIRYLSYHDQLTGIYNRSFFEEEIRRLNTKRNLPISFVLADVNCLKLANDAFGHATGDKILKKTARIIQNCCREDDIFARIGGDEFAILLPKTNISDAEKIVERIRSICQKTHLQAMSLSISFGVATKTDPSDDIRLVQKKAEDIMYKNKMCESPAMRNKTIQYIIQSLYTKYDDEKDHSRRVCSICEAMGKELSLNERELAEIKNAALLHDIGKVAINSEVLNKTSRLDDREWNEIQRHPEIGYRLLRSLSDFAYVSECILAHHERYDGKGYPKGLRGEEIPLHTRIIALAESYDAMTNERIYKKAMTKEEAAAEITRNAGSQFDPALVDVFLRVFEKNRYI